MAGRRGADGAWLGAALDEGLTCTHGDGAGGVVSWFEHPAIRTTAAVAVDNAATSVLMAFMTVFFLALGQSEMAGPLGQMLQRTPWRILGSARGETGEVITVGAQRELFQLSPDAGRSHRAFCRTRTTTTRRRRVDSPSLRGPAAWRTDDQAPRSGDPGLVVWLPMRESRIATAPSPEARQPSRLPHRLAAARGRVRGRR